MIIPINDYVLIKPFKEEKEGVVESEVLEGAPEIGIVENTHEYSDKNAIVNIVNQEYITKRTVLKKGDKVFFDKFLATEVKDKGEKYYLVKYEDIKAIIKEE